MKINIVFLVFALGILSSCARLDDSFFNPNENKISEYKLHNYTGEVDFRLDTPYQIADDKIHLFTLMSKAPDESAATKIFAVYIGDLQRIATDTVIMYCHGNKDHLDFYWPRVQLLANTNGKNNYGVFMIDYRGYGLSEGKPSEKALYADVDAALTWLASMGLTSNRLMMYGFSMGTAPATRLTADLHALQPAKLMLEAPFASSKVMVQDATGLSLPASFVTDLKIDNAEEIKKVEEPLFWIHGVKDDFLNINTHGQLVYNNHKGAFKEAHRISGAGHSDIPKVMGYQAYLKAVGDFIRK
ncbi:MAG: alpha/beta hydrolase [Chitinophagaceae bacterium]